MALITIVTGLEKPTNTTFGVPHCNVLGAPTCILSRTGPDQSASAAQLVTQQGFSIRSMDISIVAWAYEPTNAANPGKP